MRETERTHVAERGLIALGFAAVLGTISVLARAPLLVPSVGPSIFLIVDTPTTDRARPERILIGHVVGALAGLAAVFLFALNGAPPVTRAGFTWARAGAAGVAILLVVLAAEATRHAHHPPAAATTLLVALGLLNEPRELAALLGGVAVTAAGAWAYRAWHARRGLNDRTGATRPT